MAFTTSPEMEETCLSIITLRFLSNLQKSRKLFDPQTDVLVWWDNAGEAEVKASCL